MTRLLTSSLLTIALASVLPPSLCLSPPPTRTSPPAGALVVRPTPSSGEFGSLIDAVAALPSGKSAETIFVFPGTYEGQVSIQRSGPVTLLGYTAHPGNVSANTVTLVDSIPASAVGGSNDLSGTLRIHTDNVSVYNLNVRNDYGPGSQAIAVSNYGTQVGLYACGIFGFQDTLLANQGTQVYLQGYIEGATDFIFGRLGQAYFEGNTLAVSSAGYVTASGREGDNEAIYVFNANSVVAAPGAASNTSGRTYLGRPWGDYARVIFKSTTVTLPLNPAIWSEWDGSTDTANVFFAEFNTTGSGIPAGAKRPSFATLLTAQQAAAYDVAAAVGSDWAGWVDADYML
ncbi:carbohydrate esterase family 8 protein [Dentipellis sp. KUC8613]|nr:carbohydrate esterase family 8 protein [Dentipellis sp. KUC8613]